MAVYVYRKESGSLIPVAGGSGGGGGSGVLMNDIDANITCGGISSGEKIASGTSFETVFNKMLVKYINPTAAITIGASKVARQLIEKWSSIASVVLNVTAGAGSSSIDSVEVFDGSTSIKTGIGSETFTYTPEAEITQNKTFKVVVKDTQGKSASSEAYIDFIIPYYYGVNADVSTTPIHLSTKDMSKKGNKTYKFTANEQYMFIAYDYSYGALTSILDGNGFENIGNFDKVGKITETIEGKSYEFMLYRSKTVQTQTNLSLTFKY